MMNFFRLCTIMMLAGIIACNDGGTSTKEKAPAAETEIGGQEKVNDNESEKDVVKVAVSSNDHSTLVSALKQADLVTSLSNAGPFTVFAPTNAAFDQLPAGTVEGLMKDDKKEDLQNVLQYHVTLSALNAANLQDGQTLSMVNGDNVTVSVKDGKVTLNNSVHIVASVKASNGMVHIVDGVLLPGQGKK